MYKTERSIIDVIALALPVWRPGHEGAAYIALLSSEMAEDNASNPLFFKPLFEIIYEKKWYIDEPGVGGGSHHVQLTVFI